MNEETRLGPWRWRHEPDGKCTVFLDEKIFVLEEHVEGEELCELLNDLTKGSVLIQGEGDELLILDLIEEASLAATSLADTFKSGMQALHVRRAIDPVRRLFARRAATQHPVAPDAGA